MTLQIESLNPMPPDNFPADGRDDNLSVSQILSALWRRRVVFLSVIFAIAALGFVILKLLTPTYTSTAVLVLSARQDGVVDMRQPYMNMNPSDPVIRSEVDALQSRTLINRVIDREHLLADPEFNQYVRAFHPNPIVCIPARILPGFMKVKLGCKKPDASLLSPAQVKYNVASRFLKAYSVVSDTKTYSVKLSVTSADPQKASRLLNSLADEYMKSQVDERIGQAAQAAMSMNPKLAQLRKDVTQADRAVQKFQEAHHIVDLPGSEGQSNTLAVQEVQNLAAQLSSARTIRAQLEAAQQEVGKLAVNPAQILSAPAVAAAPVVENLRVQEATATAQLASLEGTYGARNPVVASAKNQVAQLRQRLSEEAQRAVLQLSAQMRQAQASERQLQARLNELTSTRTVESRTLSELRQLVSAQTAARTVYDAFVQGMYRAAAQNGVPTARGRVVQYADTVDWPTFPNMTVMMALVLLFATMTATGIVYALEAADQSFHNANQIEAATGLVVLGITLLDRSPSNRLAVREGGTVSRRMITESSSALSESVRLTRTAIAFARGDRPSKTVMITSAVPGEGKTTFALMLARQSASTGSRAIVIEAEMRQPKFGRDLSPLPPKGLADYLMGNATLEQVVGIDDVSGMHFIAAGRPNHCSSELLASKRMELLLSELRNHYDLIVLDTPPAAIVADALQLGGIVDSAILVVKWASTPRYLMLDAIKKLRAVRAPLTGVVMAQVDARQYKHYGQGILPYEYARSYYTGA
ncbi:MAG TPA: polysaccharide biosynthesis tyrosine autokinase [Rhizomicrobium sp.]|nr:polysaccharide biosynthesis tyrosine autokinase [Rhizomicrobium sp.]